MYIAFPYSLPTNFGCDSNFCALLYIEIETFSKLFSSFFRFYVCLRFPASHILCFALLSHPEPDSVLAMAKLEQASYLPERARGGPGAADGTRSDYGCRGPAVQPSRALHIQRALSGSFACNSTVGAIRTYVRTYSAWVFHHTFSWRRYYYCCPTLFLS